MPSKYEQEDARGRTSRVQGPRRGKHMEVSKQINEKHQIAFLWLKRNFKQDLRCLLGKKMFSSLLYGYVFPPLSSRAEVASITVFTANVCWNGSMEKRKLSAFKVCKVNTALTCFSSSAALVRRYSMQKSGPGSRAWKCNCYIRSSQIQTLLAQYRAFNVDLT